MLAVVVALAAPGSAFAHGIYAASSDSVPGFVRIGFLHMLTGYDHLLFAGGVVLLAGQIRLAPKLISLFVVGHSLTLLIATLFGWRVNAAAVDVVIALSVAWVGLRLLKGRPERWRATAAVIFCFGLVHGLGLSTRLQDLQLSGGEALVARILAFNLGVELGQIAALTAIVSVALLLRHGLRIARTVERPVGGLLVAIGFVFAAALGFSAAKPDTIAAAGRDPNATCAEQPRPAAAPTTGAGGHPERFFYSPGQAPPERNLAHVQRDGYVVVRYRTDLPGDAQEALAQWSAREPGVVVVPVERANAPLVEATSSASLFACNGVNVDKLGAFRQRWTAARQKASTNPTSPAATQTTNTPTRTATEPATTEPKTVTRTANRVEFVIRVERGRPIGGVQRLSAKYRNRITLRVSSDVVDVVHLHGYNIERPVALGTPAVLRFVANTVGRFEFELEKSGVLIGDLSVLP